MSEVSGLGAGHETVVKRSVVVHVAGQRYVVRSDADEAYVQQLAAYVNDRISEVQQASKVVSSQALAVLAALNIAGDYFRERQQRSDLKSRVRERSKAVLALVDKEVRQRRHDT
jgi:cell division protein ZapA